MNRTVQPLYRPVQLRRTFFGAGVILAVMLWLFIIGIALGNVVGWLCV